MSDDRIEKKILLNATRERVWRALSDSTEFGSWFGVKFDGPFTPGAVMRGVIVPSATGARNEYEGTPFEITIEHMEPQRLFSFRWHPFAVEHGVDYSAEPTTLVVFELKEMAGTILLTVTESGFDQIPLERRAKAFTMNDRGWEAMVKTLAEYVVNAP